MADKFLVWKPFFYSVIVTAFIIFLYLGLFDKETGFPRQCTCYRPSFDNNHRAKPTYSDREKNEINDGQEDNSVFRVESSTSNVKQLSKVDETRPLDRIDNINRNQGNTITTNRPKGLVHLLDYVKYPCLPGSNQLKRLRPLARCIRSVNVPLVADTVKSIECVTLNFGTSIPICIHDPRMDKLVSGSIFKTGCWERKLLGTFFEALSKVKDAILLDIGCNIGVYTLMAAREGKRVVSIDANVQNLRLLSKSLILGQLRENVTLIWHAMSDTYTNVTLNTNPFNVARFSVNTDKKTTSGDEDVIQTILLDDLMYLMEGKPVVIKMDVERFELHVLKGGVTFLKNIDVRFIQIEIRHHIKFPSAQEIVSILRHLGFTPFATCLGKNNVTDLPLKDWPHDVCFIKNIYKTSDADKN